MLKKNYFLINDTGGSKQQAVKYQPDRYESFLSLDMLDQVFMLQKYVSFLKSGKGGGGALAGQLGTIDTRAKICICKPGNQ